MRLILTVIFVLLTGCCNAATFGLHLGTYHFERQYNFNEFNPGVYVEHNKIVTGAYLNSLQKVSIYSGYKLEISKIDVILGAVTGYGGIKPMVVPSYKFDNGVRVSLIPKSPGVKNSSGGFHVSYEF
jgi:hypothetical protein